MGKLYVRYEAMANDSLVLTLDFGTQSVRSALVDKKGNIVSLVKKLVNSYCFPRKKPYNKKQQALDLVFAIFHFSYILFT